jgi:hypothetical protein
MEETVTKKSRRMVHNYNFNDKTVNLNGYVAICTITGNEKRFYHSYLANMIEKKFDNNFSTFESTYVSREGKSVGANDRKAEDIENRINVLYSKIAQLKSQRDHLQAA